MTFRLKMIAGLSVFSAIEALIFTVCVECGLPVNESCAIVAIAPILFFMLLLLTLAIIYPDEWLGK